MGLSWDLGSIEKLRQEEVWEGVLTNSCLGLFTVHAPQFIPLIPFDKSSHDPKAGRIAPI